MSILVDKNTMNSCRPDRQDRNLLHTEQASLITAPRYRRHPSQEGRGETWTGAKGQTPIFATVAEWAEDWR